MKEPPPASPIVAPPPGSEKRKTSLPGLLLVLGLVAMVLGCLGLGGYVVYRYFLEQQVAVPAQRTPVIKATPRQQPSPTSTPTPTPTPTPRPTPTPTPRSLPTPTPRPTPVPTPVPTPTPEEEPSTPSPTPETIVSPSPTPEEEITPSPTPEERNKPTPVPTPLDDFQEKLGAAQELGEKTGDWQSALAAYLDLVDRFPERSIAIKRLDNLLAELHGTEESRMPSLTRPQNQTWFVPLKRELSLQC